MKISQFKRRQFLKISSLAVGSSLLAACQNSSNSSLLSETGEKLDQVKLALGWKAQAEYGGFYQAVATGIYQDYGLNVTVEQSSPQSNTTQLLMAGLVDFIISSSVNTLKAVQEGVPKIAIAAPFQKEIQIFVAHPDMGNDSFAALTGKPIYISSGALTTYWPFLKAKYGYTDEQQRPYNFNISPFLIDKNSIQQGILTSEPYTIEKQAGFKPVILPLYDAGYNPYNFMIETRKNLVDTNPDLVQRFVTASLKGWSSYLENPIPGNELIKQDNPEMTDELINYSLEKLNEYGIILSGDAETLGLGAMTAQRWQTLYNDLVAVGVLKDNLNYQDAYTLDFINTLGN